MDVGVSLERRRRYDVMVNDAKAVVTGDMSKLYNDIKTLLCASRVPVTEAACETDTVELQKDISKLLRNAQRPGFDGTFESALSEPQKQHKKTYMEAWQQKTGKNPEEDETAAFAILQQRTPLLTTAGIR